MPAADDACERPGPSGSPGAGPSGQQGSRAERAERGERLGAAPEPSQVWLELGRVSARIDAVERSVARFQEHLSKQDITTDRRFQHVDEAIARIEQKLGVFDTFLAEYRADAPQREALAKAALNMTSVGAQFKSLDQHRSDHMRKQDEEMTALRAAIEAQKEREAERVRVEQERLRVDQEQRALVERHNEEARMQRVAMQRAIATGFASLRTGIGVPASVAILGYFLLNQHTLSGQSKMLALGLLGVVVASYFIPQLLAALHPVSVPPSARTPARGDDTPDTPGI